LEVGAPTPWWIYALAALAALLLGLGIWRWLRRRVGAGGATGDPYADALAAFARIEKLKLVESGEAGRHAALMTDVVRRYLAERVEGVSLAQTSGELLAAVRSAPTVPVDALQSLVSDVDPVKFANAPLSADRARVLGDEAKRLVNTEHEQRAALA